MTLPEIPDEAVRAVVAGFMDPDDLNAPGEAEWAREDLTRAWPHLYAAALRHAAERIDRQAGFDPGMRGREAAVLLRSLADEAVTE